MAWGKGVPGFRSKSSPSFKQKPVELKVDNSAISAPPIDASVLDPAIAENVDLTLKPVHGHDHDGVNTPRIKYKNIAVQPGDVEIIVPFTAGEALTKGSAVYLKTSDGKVYLTDATNTTKTNFIGFATDSAAIGDRVGIRTAGIQGGFSGLTPGTKYYLANAASTDTVSYTTHTNGFSTWSGTAGVSAGFSMKFTLTHTTKINSFDIRVDKDGTPSNFLIYVCAGDQTNSVELYQGASILVSESYAQTGFDTAEATKTLSLTTPIIVPPGIYTVIFRETTGDLGWNYNLWGTAHAAVTIGQYTTRVDTVSWSAGGNATDLYFVGNFEALTKAAGTIHEYFFDIPKLVGIAVSSTELYIINNAAQISQGRLTVSTETPTTITLGYAPKMVMAFALNDSGYTLFSFGAASFEDQGCVALYQTFGPVFTAEVLADKIYRAASFEGGGGYATGSDGAIVMLSTGFIFGPSNIGAAPDALVQWIAFE
jgi:hypothetical protein